MEKLPEEFAPTGPKLSRFPIQPAPPMRPRLFADEARFALRVSVLAGATEFAAWSFLAGERTGAVLVLAALRCLKPLWARLGTRMPRPAVAIGLVAVWFAALAWWLISSRGTSGSSGASFAAMLVAAGLPSLADLAATCVADSVTVERRAAAFAWLDMAQALGAVIAVAVMQVAPRSIGLALVAGCFLAAVACAPALHDRGTPRSAWPAASYGSALNSPLTRNLCLVAIAAGALAMNALHASPFWDALPIFGKPMAPRWALAVAPLAGMAIAARLDRFAPNAIFLPRVALAVAVVARCLSIAPLGLLALGMMFALIPASVMRGAGEMDRPLASSWAWSALVAGAAAGAFF